MKSFSPAGAATKAYYGLGARTFGNPSGARSGDGSLTGPSAWRIVFQGFQAGSLPESVAVLDTQRAVAGCSTTGEIVYTIDAGTTWLDGTQVANPRQFVAEFAYNGSVLIAYGNDGANHAQLCRSLDGGATWTDVSPVHPSFVQPEFGTSYLCVQWSQSLRLFVCFASAALGVNVTCFTSADGLVWSAHILALPSLFLGDFRAANDGVIIVGGFAVAPAPSAGIIQRSIDGGVTWTVVLNVPGVFFVDTLEFNGVSWVACGDSGSNAFNYASSNGIIWALRNTVPIDTIPPYHSTLATLNGVFVVAANSLAATTADLGVTSNGISWQQVTVPNNVFNVLTISGMLYAIGSGISVSLDGTNWVSQLTQNGTLDVIGVGASGPQSQSGMLGIAAGNDSANNPSIWRFGP